MINERGFTQNRKFKVNDLPSTHKKSSFRNSQVTVSCYRTLEDIGHVNDLVLSSSFLI